MSRSHKLSQGLLKEAFIFWIWSVEDAHQEAAYKVRVKVPEIGVISGFIGATIASLRCVFAINLMFGLEPSHHIEVQEVVAFHQEATTGQDEAVYMLQEQIIRAHRVQLGLNTGGTYGPASEQTGCKMGFLRLAGVLAGEEELGFSALGCFDPMDFSSMVRTLQVGDYF